MRDATQQEMQDGVLTVTLGTLPPGPALDAQIAVALLGFRWFRCPRRNLIALFPPHEEDRLNWGPGWEDVTGREGEFERFADALRQVPPVSTTGGGMLLLGAALEARGLWWRVGPHHEGGYSAIIGNWEGTMEAVNWVEETAPAALCRACLRALGKEGEGC